MWYLAYNVLLILAAPVVLVVLLAKKRCRPGLLYRLGFRLPEPPVRKGAVVWIHAVSLGEVMAVVPLVHALHRRFPSITIKVSTITETGREAVEQKLGGIAEHCYLPLDYPWMAKRFVRSIQPAAYIFVETELWPNLLRVCGRDDVPAVLVNGRVSSRSFGRYRWIQGFMRTVLANVSLCLMQSQRDGDRICQLGASPARVLCTGNMKFDQDMAAGQAGLEGIAAAALGILPTEVLVVAGSTHAEEEEILLTAYRILVDEGVNFVLLLAPRHIERTNDVIKHIASKGIRAIRRSDISPDNNQSSVAGPRVIVLDTRGELRRVYGVCRLAFVGGTLTPVGGHNLLEPAAWGKPVVFGPYTDHCEEMAGLLLAEGGGIRVGNQQELTEVMRRGIRDPRWAAQVGDRAKALVIRNQGVTKRNLDHIGALLESRLCHSM